MVEEVGVVGEGAVVFDAEVHRHAPGPLEDRPHVPVERDQHLALPERGVAVQRVDPHDRRAQFRGRMDRAHGPVDVGLGLPGGEVGGDEQGADAHALVRQPALELVRRRRVFHRAGRPVTPTNKRRRKIPPHVDLDGRDAQLAQVLKNPPRVHLRQHRVPDRHVHVCSQSRVKMQPPRRRDAETAAEKDEKR